MNRDKLWETRFKPMLAEVYAKSEGPTKEVWPQDWDNWKNHPVWGFEYDNKPVIVVPVNIFWMDHDKMKSIVAKWCKGLHGFWYYMPKLDFEDPEYDAKCKELYNFRDFEAKVSQDKSLTYAQRAAKIKKEALAHNFMWRSRDKEFIEQNFWLGVSPTSSKESFENGLTMYNAIENVYNNGGFENTYVDYTHMNQFAYTKDGVEYTAKIENVMKWFDRNGKYHEEMSPDYEFCNLYNTEDEFIERLWSPIEVTKNMSAKTFEAINDIVKPLVYDELIKQGHTGLAENIKNDIHRMGYDFKQCLALFINHLNYMETLR